MSAYTTSKVTVIYNKEDITDYVLRNMGDQTKLRPLPVEQEITDTAQKYAATFGVSVEHARELIEDIVIINNVTAQCAFCGVDLALYESAQLTATYAGLTFCGETCLNSWIDGAAQGFGR